MNYYETLYIVHSALEAGRLKDIVLTVEKSLKENGGELVATEIWGKKKLGYYIDKQKYGTYILIQFKSDGTKNNNFNIQMEHNPSILAYMTVKIEEDGIREQTEDLDTQIAGKEAKTSRAAPRRVEEKVSTEEKTGNMVEETPAEEVAVEEAPVEVEKSKKEPVAEEIAVEEAPVEVEKSKKEPVAEEVAVEEETASETEVASEEKVEE